MQPTYRVDQISAALIDPAYLLVSPVAPTLDLEGWRAFCRDLLAREVHSNDLDVVLVAVNPLGYVQGVCVCTVKTHPAHGRILDVPIFVVTSVADQAGVGTELLRRLTGFARQEACKAVHIWRLAEDNWGRHLSQSMVPGHDDSVLMILEVTAPV